MSSDDDILEANGMLMLMLMNMLKLMLMDMLNLMLMNTLLL